MSFKRRFYRAMALGKTTKFFKREWKSLIRQFNNSVATITKKHISKKTAIVPNKIVFMHYNNAYGCNPAYICNEILHEKLPWDLVYITDKAHIHDIPDGVRAVKCYSYEHFVEAASAKIWIDNAVCFPWVHVPKKKGQIYIDTWHGSMGLKRIGKDNVPSELWLKAANTASKEVDFVISNSTFEDKVYRETWWPDERTKILHFGHPRNDILFTENPDEIRREVCDFYNVPEDTQFILYAPTFRETSISTDCYDLDYEQLINVVEKKFGGSWCVISRLHFKTVMALKNKKRGNVFNWHVLDGGKYTDIQRLMVACDIGITDYSSWICDYVLTGKPAFIYAKDLANYIENERGFYYDLHSTPFPVAETNLELLQVIYNYNPSTYEAKRLDFLKRLGCVETGTAAHQTVEFMKQFITG